jgi:hypothetical protein
VQLTEKQRGSGKRLEIESAQPHRKASTRGKRGVVLDSHSTGEEFPYLFFFKHNSDSTEAFLGIVLKQNCTSLIKDTLDLFTLVKLLERCPSSRWAAPGPNAKLEP